MSAHYRPNYQRSHSTPQWIAPDNAFAGYEAFSLVFLSHGGSSPLKRDSQPELYPSSGESRCFLFLDFD